MNIMGKLLVNPSDHFPQLSDLNFHHDLEQNPLGFHHCKLHMPTHQLNPIQSVN